MSNSSSTDAIICHSAQAPNHIVQILNQSRVCNSDNHSLLKPFQFHSTCSAHLTRDKYQQKLFLLIPICLRLPCVYGQNRL